jgi:hypothetical protein
MSSGSVSMAGAGKRLAEGWVMDGFRHVREVADMPEP